MTRPLNRKKEDLVNGGTIGTIGASSLEFDTDYPKMNK